MIRALEKACSGEPDVVLILLFQIRAGKPLPLCVTLMANKKDTCSTGFLLKDLGTDAVKLPEGVTVEDLESIGQGQGISFWLTPGDGLEFPKLADARIDIEPFKKSNGTTGYALVARVYQKSLGDWTWMPLSALRKVPCNDYKEFLTEAAQATFLAPLEGKDEETILNAIKAKGLEVFKDGRLYRPVNEEREFFADYPLGRELAARNKSDLGLYRELCGRKFTVIDCVALHRHEFGYNKATGQAVRLDTFKGLLCFKFEEIVKKS